MRAPVPSYVIEGAVRANRAGFGALVLPHGWTRRSVFERLETEHEAFDRTLVDLDDRGWSHPTRCEGWDVRDLVCHLWIQAAAARAVSTDAPSILDGLPSDLSEFDAWVDGFVQGHGDVPGREVWRRWREPRTAAVAGLCNRPEDQRVRWTLGELRPSMLGTVLAMETWTHHRDVRGPLGLPAEPTPAVRTSPTWYIAPCRGRSTMQARSPGRFASSCSGRTVRSGTTALRTPRGSCGATSRSCAASRPSDSRSVRQRRSKPKARLHGSPCG